MNSIANICNLELKELSKVFKYGHTQTSVLQKITCVFNQNQVYIVRGNSGTGKTTLLHLLAGIEEPSAGSILFNNEDISLLDLKAKQTFFQHTIGFIYQYPYLIDELSIVENVMIKGLIQGHAYESAKNEALLLLENVNLMHKAYALPNTLSGGEQQRVAIARALFNKPVFLLADEPTAHLDEKNAHIIMNLLRQFHTDYKMGLIIASHDLAIIEPNDCVLNLNNGLLS